MGFTIRIDNDDPAVQTPAPEGPHKAGDPGFEWQGNFHEGGGGLTFTKVGGLVFATGYAYYDGALTPSAVCALPAGWQDAQGVDALCFANGDQEQEVGVYAGPNGLNVGNDDATDNLPDNVSDDGYVAIQAFWPAA